MTIFNKEAAARASQNQEPWVRARIWDYSRLVLVVAAIGCHWLPWVKVARGPVLGVQTTLGFWSVLTMLAAGGAILTGRWRGGGKRKRWQLLELTDAAVTLICQIITYWTVVTTPTQTKIVQGGLFQGGLFKIKIPTLVFPRSLMWGMDTALGAASLVTLAAAVALIVTIRGRARRDAHRKVVASVPELAQAPL